MPFIEGQSNCNCTSWGVVDYIAILMKEDPAGHGVTHLQDCQQLHYLEQKPSLLMKWIEFPRL